MSAQRELFALLAGVGVTPALAVRYIHRSQQAGSGWALGERLMSRQDFAKLCGLLPFVLDNARRQCVLRGEPPDELGKLETWRRDASDFLRRVLQHAPEIAAAALAHANVIAAALDSSEGDEGMRKLTAHYAQQRPRRGRPQ